MGTSKETADDAVGDELTTSQTSADQVRHEPIPASHEDDPRQEAVVRNEQHPGPEADSASPPASRREPDSRHGQDGS